MGLTTWTNLPRAVHKKGMCRNSRSNSVGAAGTDDFNRRDSLADPRVLPKCRNARPFSKESDISV
jgi:hypothetical protein